MGFGASTVLQRTTSREEGILNSNWPSGEQLKRCRCVEDAVFRVGE